MQSPQSKEDNISTVIGLIREGVACWEKAGSLLHEMRLKTPSIFAEFCKREPLLTIDLLMTLERIGQKLLHPKLILDQSLASKRAMAYSFEEQCRLVDGGVEIVVSVENGNPVVVKRTLSMVNRSEMLRVFGPKNVRTVSEQVAMFSGSGRKLDSKPEPNHHEVRAHTPASQTVGTKLVGRWAVRKTIGNNCGFERTNADPPHKTIIVLGDDVAVVEIRSRQE